MRELDVKRKAARRRPGSREAAKAVSGARRRKRRVRKYTIYYILIIIIVLSAMVTLSMTVFFNIKRFDVSESEFYTKEEIIEASGIEAGENMIRLDIGKAKQKILDELIYVDNVTLKRKLPDTLQIEFTTAEITYNYKIDGSYAYISQNGRILELGKDEPYSGVLTVLGLDVENPNVGMFIDDDSGQMERLKNIRQALEENGFEDITLLDISSEVQTKVVYQDRITIEISIEDDEDYIIKAAKSIIDDSIGINERGRILYIKSTQQIHFVPEED